MKATFLIIAVVALVGCGESKEEKAAAEAKAAAEDKAGAWVADPNDSNNVKIEKAIRETPSVRRLFAEARASGEPMGELTKADLEEVTHLNLHGNHHGNGLTDVKGLEKLTQLEVLNLGSNQLTSVKGLEKLTRLRVLNLANNPALTKAQIDELQKALPKCKITHNATK